MINEGGTVGGMKIGKGSQNTLINPMQCHSIHHKSRMIWN
jgi:hypothetical protein